MHGQGLWSHTKGYVIIRAKGRRLEAFINGAIGVGIPLWRLERAAPNMLVARVLAADFARLARGARRFGVRVTVLQKVGLPFWLARLGRRRVFVVTGLLFALALYGLAQFVWLVRVDGNEQLTEAEILLVAERSGLHPGVGRNEVQPDEVVYMLHRELPRLAWVGIDVKGTLATIRVAERTVPNPALHGPGHIVAVADGIVERMIVTRGVAVVDVGDTVEEGELLISGRMSDAKPDEPEPSEEAEDVPASSMDEGDESPLVRAEGSVWGRVWYRAFAEVTLSGSGHDEVAVAETSAEAVAVADEALSRRIPSGADVRERDVVIVEELSLQPAVVRATVTVAVYQPLGRFVPISATDGDDDPLDGDDLPDLDDGPLKDE